MKVLFIGGTGTISSACTELALKKGIDLCHFNRGLSHRKYNDVETIIGDIRNFNESKNLLNDLYFDVVVDWVGFTTEHVKADIELFKNRIKQFIFISSSSVYQKPVKILPITENTPLYNPFMKYAQDKIDCENILMDAYKLIGFPVTIVRPSQTYDRTTIPTNWGYTEIDRMLKNKKIIIHGDGTSAWSITHNSDFAKGFAGLLGNEKTIGESFHITTDEITNWNQIYGLLAKELNVKLDAVHIASEFIASVDETAGINLLNNRMYSMIFDNSKIKKFVPDFNASIRYEDGAKEIIGWYNKNPGWGKVDEKSDAMIDKIINCYLN